MSLLGVSMVLMAAPVAAYAYAYVVYPAGLFALAATRRVVRGRRPGPAEVSAWPKISFSLPAYNEEATITGALDAILAVDYPEDRRQILVTSDASTDRTDELVSAYAGRGVELLRLRERGGKTAAENESSRHLTGDIIINTDASIRVRPDSVKPLVRALADPTVGVASGRDVSVGVAGTEGNVGETGYVGYEMWVRSLESELGSIIGASGCFYAIRRDLHLISVPPLLSRDFAAVLKARSAGYRSVHVHDAVCLVPRTGSASIEYRRKVRTISRGIDTQLHYRSLLNPLRYGGFAIRLASHKLGRWLPPALLPLGGLGLILAATESAVFAWGLAAAASSIAVAWASIRWPRLPPRLRRIISIPAYVLAANIACIAAWVNVVRGRGEVVWEPTRRGVPAGDDAPRGPRSRPGR